MEVLEHSNQTYYTLARCISKGSESEWLWVSHSPKDWSDNPDPVTQHVDVLNSHHLFKDSPYFVVKVMISNQIERVRSDRPSGNERNRSSNGSDSEVSSSGDTGSGNDDSGIHSAIPR